MTEPGAPAEELCDAATMDQLMRAAERYGMRVDVTDWQAVCRAASRTGKATATLAAAAGDRPLRAIPPTPR